MMSTSIPLLKGKRLVERITLAIEKDLYEELMHAKENGVDHTEWIRMIIRAELPKLKKQVTAA